VFLVQEERATETSSKMEKASQKDNSGSKTDVAAMAESLKVSFLDWHHISLAII